MKVCFLFNFSSMATPAMCVVLFVSACSEPTITSAGNLSPGAMGHEPREIIESQPPQLTPSQQRRLDLFKATLFESSDSDPSRRVDAAEELLLMRLTQALDVLDQALCSGRSPVILAVIEAMDKQPEPVPGLLEPAVFALTNSPEDVIDRLSVVLTQYDDQALRKIAALALDEQATVNNRLGPIRALSAVRSRESAARLIDIIKQSPGKSSLIHSTACEALSQLTGFNYGTNVRSWLGWWDEFREKPLEEWDRVMIANLQSQITRLVDENNDLRAQLKVKSDLVIQVYEDLFPLLTEQDRLNKLPQLLENTDSSVREYAIERIQRILRDTSTIPVELQDKLAAQMGDEKPVIRRQTAELLDSLGYPTIADRVAQAISNESNPDVISSYLKILTARTSPDALEPLCNLLSDETFCDAAAAALWELLLSEHVTEAARATTQTSLAAALNNRQNTPLLRLKALIADEDKLIELESKLDDEDLNVRRAIAEGFARRGHRQPLLDRGTDEIIYPYAVRSFKGGTSDMTGFRRLATLRPMPEHQGLWESAVKAYTLSLPSSLSLEIDNNLQGLAYAPLELRSILLGRIAVLPEEQVAVQDRSSIIARLVPILLELGEVPRAYEFLDTLPNIQSGSTLARLKFHTALLIGHWDVARQLDDSLLSWISVLDSISTVKKDAAARLRDEINVRFESQLVDNANAKAAFDAASAKIPPPQPDPAMQDAAGGISPR